MATEAADRQNYPQFLAEIGSAVTGTDPNEVVIGVSPAFGVEIFRTTAGHLLSDVVDALVDGVEQGGGTARLIRVRHSADTSFIGLSAARMAGSGIGIGIQAKGTAVMHGSDRMPHYNIELFSNAPLATIDHYRTLGYNAARRTFGEEKEPVVIPFTGEAMAARFHARVAILFAIETELTDESAEPVQLSRIQKGN
nr:glycerol dehydratase reactivase beta/small subunit family protein [Ruegeria sp. HKCCD8929]